MRCTRKQTRSSFGWNIVAAPAVPPLRCARNSSLAGRVRSTQTAYASECAERTHVRESEAHWLRAFLTELFTAGDILPSRRR